MSTTIIEGQAEQTGSHFTFDLALRDVQAVGRGNAYRFLEGRAVPYGVFGDLGYFLEAHAAGSFARSIKGAGKTAPLLLMHDNASLDGIVGHAESWTSAEDGLHGVWRLDGGAGAQRAAAMAEAGDLRGLSIGFQPIRSQWTLVDELAPDLGPDYLDRVLRLESRLVEVSMTPTPVFADAQVSAVRSDEHRAAYVQRRGSWLATAGPTRSETPKADSFRRFLANHPARQTPSATMRG